MIKNKTILNILKKIIFYVFFIWIFYFFWKSIYNNLDKVLNYDFKFNYSFLILSIVFYILFYLWLTILWKFLLPKNNIRFKEILYINTVSWISKYLPWKLAIIVTKVLYLNEKWIGKRYGFISCIYEQIFQIVGSIFISIPFIFYYFLGTDNNYYTYLSILFFVWFVVSIHPYIFNNVLNIWFRILKKEPLTKTDFLSTISILKYIGSYSIVMIIKWLSFLLLVLSIVYIPVADYTFLVFAWIFAWVIWIISIFAPNWLWVREWVLVFLLNFILPLEISIIISVVSRLWSTIVDGIIWLYILYFKIRK